MDLIKNLLGRYAKLGNDSESKKRVVVEVVKNITKLDIELSGVNINGAIVQLMAPPVVKSEVFIKQSELLAAIKSHPAGFEVSTIR